MVKGRMEMTARGEAGRGKMKEEQGENKEECEGKQWEGEGKRGRISEECEKNKRVRGGRKRTKKGKEGRM